MRPPHNGNMHHMSISECSITPVAIVGAGPVGLSLALGLAAHGVRSTVLERNAGTSDTSKAPGIHLRTREILRPWGIEERLLEAGTLRQQLAIHSVDRPGKPLLSYDFCELDPEADRPGILVLEQGRTEDLLLEAVRETGLCDVRFGAEVIGLQPGTDGALLRIREGEAERTVAAEFVAGCDGGSSFVRSALDLPFDGHTYSLGAWLADVRVDAARDDLAWPRLAVEPAGVTATLRLDDRLWRIIRLERGGVDDVDGQEIPASEVRRRATDVVGDGPLDIVWANRFRFHRRAAPRFRVGRVLLAGDAAHLQPPIGGQGMNAGIADAGNLAWKLAAALRGGEVDRLLDSYDVERREAVVGGVNRYTDLLTRVFLQTPLPLRAAAFACMRAALRIPVLRRKALRRLTMIDLGYSSSPVLEAGERAAGRRLPNPLLLSPGGGRVRLHDLLGSRPVLLDVAEQRSLEQQPLAEDLPVDAVVRIGPGGYSDPTGSVRGLLGDRDGWVLVRPDAHVAWARYDGDGLAGAARHAMGAAGRGKSHETIARTANR